MPVTYLIKLSLTVDFILVNKGEHNPVTDNGTLERGDKWERESELFEWWSELSLSRQTKRGMQSLLTIPTEVMAVTVLMMVGMGLNLPAWKKYIDLNNPVLLDN